MYVKEWFIMLVTYIAAGKKHRPVVCPVLETHMLKLTYHGEAPDFASISFGPSL